ncbi:sugar transporter [Moraxella nasicaprae]|uniref:Sugar transporter n=1 Tax=Moraxella nasicaprae TaxID=2904122 RepID=A0ABY6F473_9GAMM|nr:sugar transporter [Moraxella nasicaprae]UXZ04787.1 sugar transporter [Moraxella nasicaprae]
MTNTQNNGLIPVIILALSAFIFNTTEFIPVALLSDIGTSFGMNNSQTGVMMTIYAWIVALLSLPMMLATAKMERKKLLLFVFVLFAISHLVSYLASSFMMLLISRAMVAIAHAIFWSITASLVVRLAPKDMQSKALGYLSTGGALAMVLGLPIGRLLGQWLGWRSSFGIIGIISLLVAGLLAYYLPKLPAKNTGDLSSLPFVIKNKPILMIYLLIVLIVTANFTTYSYIEPFVITFAQLGGQVATSTLLIFGVAGVIGSLLFGRYYDKHGLTFIQTALFTIFIALSSFALLSGQISTWMMVILIWGIANTGAGLALQIRLLTHASRETDVAMSIFSGIFNIGIGAGAMIGGLTITHLGLGMIGYVSAAIVLSAIVLFVVTARKSI